MGEAAAGDSERPLAPGQIGLAMYALITTSVVLASVDDEAPLYVAALMLGQGLSLTLAHGYAESVAHQHTLLDGLKHALPILYAALPPAVVALVLASSDSTATPPSTPPWRSTSRCCWCCRAWPPDASASPGLVWSARC